ncbi:hypothetical protein [Arthrobacter sp. zg-Y1110]|uniref:hypothetical protein n=1 Tax=Arthrobacter sp. zg-Y1110 TaxID=2886932 RepID=UPI001D154B8F|nr:hypothetical protein [Arthrobacter sp. zg-Y1110]MCC3292626.1 hypothetical protein [Arthrobacter sp. zg-Y1110]UWX86943.1 hypothetical protein N2K99_16455 [Arthrobacter sp. zg-Y1110]
MIARVPEGVPAGGQFTPTGHEEAAAVVLTGKFPEAEQVEQARAMISDRELTITQNLYRDALIKRQKAVDDVANLALGQIAIHTLREFPDAATIRVEPNPTGEGMTILGVHAANGAPIATADGTADEEARLNRFRDMSGFGGASMDVLATELPVQDADWWKHAEPVDEWESVHDVDIRAAAAWS